MGLVYVYYIDKSSTITSTVPLPILLVLYTQEFCLVPEIIDPVFAKTSPKCSFCMTENERFGLVFAKTGSINSGTAD
jgi:hypothetical protein